jgi:hypothetical protein
MIRQLVPVAAGLAAGLAGCGPPEVPIQPSWDQDVFPIIQGSCGHCHGSTVGKEPGPTSRLDVCSIDAAVAAGIPVRLNPALFGAANLSTTFGDYLTVKGGMNRPSMPPPPAGPLLDYQRDVLLRWAQVALLTRPPAGQPHPACAKLRNGDPSAVLVGRSRSGNDLEVTLEVIDPDKDQVLGKITAGGSEPQPIDSLGRSTYRFAGQPMDADLEVTLHDGYVAAPIIVDL